MLLSALGAAPCAAEGGASPASPGVGSLAYREGELALTRGGEELAEPAIGQTIENFDLVRTGADGLAQIEITSPAAARCTITVGPATSLSIEIARYGAKHQTTLGIIGGSLTLKASRLSAGQALTVRTDSASMGVRGTQFSVESPASGDLLVTCDEGEVSCIDEEGALITATAGMAVEKDADAAFRALPVGGRPLEALRAQWRTERFQSLSRNALPTSRSLAAQYRRLRRDFDRDYAALMRQRRVIDKWRGEEGTGRLGRPGELAAERSAVARHLSALRRTMFRLERIEHRLLQLSALHARGIGRGHLDEESSDQFFERLLREHGELERKMAAVRFIARLYAERSDGQLPEDAFGGNERAER